VIWRTEDREFIRSIVTHPRVWARVASDGLNPDEYEPVIHPRVHYLTDGRGFFSWKPLSTVCYEGHIAHLGSDAEAFANQACEWMFANGAKKLAILCPSYNWHAKSMALRVGFRCEGLLTSAVEWRGRLHDLTLMGMSYGGNR
jgi:hypothetical protein